MDRNQLWNCTHFRDPTDEQLGHVDIFLATTIICSLSTLNSRIYARDSPEFHPKCPNIVARITFCLITSNNFFGPDKVFYFENIRVVRRTRWQGTPD